MNETAEQKYVRGFKAPKSLGVASFFNEFIRRFPHDKLVVKEVPNDFLEFYVIVPAERRADLDPFWVEFCRARAAMSES